MGGYGSGRPSSRATVESGLKLNLAKLMKDGLVRPGVSCAGSLTWTNTATGEKVCSIGFETQMGDESGRARLHYTTTRRNGEKVDSDYWIGLETTPQPFGGRRWWFVCPRTGDHVAKLYLPAGATRFASGKAYQLSYRSQRESPHDRALSQAFRLRSRLGAEGGIGDYVPKPKGMRWVTYERQMARIAAAEAVCNARLLFFVPKLGGRI